MKNKKQRSFDSRKHYSEKENPSNIRNVVYYPDFSLYCYNLHLSVYFLAEAVGIILCVNVST